MPQTRLPRRVRYAERAMPTRRERVVWREDVPTGTRCDGELNEGFQLDIHLGPSGTDRWVLMGFRMSCPARALVT